jgi:transcriptional regulator with XRE-family HTH domain
MKVLTVNQAVRNRINELLIKQNITAYRIAENSGISHARLGCILHDKNKTVTLTTVMLLAQGFNISLIEFLDSPYFNNDNLDLDM